jgi:hypothetical protein
LAKWRIIILFFNKCTNKYAENFIFAQMKVQNNGRVTRSF